MGLLNRLRQLISGGSSDSAQVADSKEKLEAETQFKEEPAKAAAATSAPEPASEPAQEQVVADADSTPEPAAATETKPQETPPPREDSRESDLMIYEGKAISVTDAGDGIAELKFDNQGESVNKFDQATLADLDAAVKALQAKSDLKGVIVTSGKPVFIVGADISEFGGAFQNPKEELLEWIGKSNAIFNAFEDLPVPTVAAINGTALGGGFEMCLACDFRVMGDKAEVGLPEVKLGIFPGFGGTVRLPRVIGADWAIEWITQGKSYKGEKAIEFGAVDAVVATDDLRDAALQMAKDAANGVFDYQARKDEKNSPLNLDEIEADTVFRLSTMFAMNVTKGNYPAPVRVLQVMQKAAGLDRAGSLALEADGFADMAKTTVADSLIGLFMNDQFIKGKAKKYAKIAQPVNRAAVLGAGIMGGGIAYQSALKGFPIIMKDIAQDAIELGKAEAAKLLQKKVDRKRMTTQQMAKVLGDIDTTLSYGDFDSVDVVVEAVVENPKIKGIVLAEVEKAAPNAVITSNTSSISIDLLAKSVQKPENFLGMHFFNPVHMMPLVEVIRGEKTSDEAIATVVNYATKMGKTAIVVRDCPGFLVNRVLFPYLGGFQMLVNDGCDFVQIDKVMEKFGWPMGPAYLSDVVGMDTAHHVRDVLADGYPERMASTDRTSLDVMYENERFGQKNDKGYYRYELDRKGKPKKIKDPEVYDLLKDVTGEITKFSPQDIIDRMMIPMVIEVARCLEEDIVDSVAEADMGLIMGIGFPPFRGGAFKYADTVGLAKIVETADKYVEKYGPLYQVTDRMREMAANGETYYQK